MDPTTSRRIAAALIVILITMGSGCGANSAESEVFARSIEPVASVPIEATETADPTKTDEDSLLPPASPAPTPDLTAPAEVATSRPSLADKIVSLPSVVPGLPEQAEQLAPVRLQIPSIGVDAEIIAVGVDANGDFDVPPAHQVGWYQFGTTPGQPGSAVLAAHIAYNGSDGVFRSLDDVEPGESILVTFDDGSTVDLVTTALSQYDKDELPDDLFARSGSPRVVLITCGGDFNRGRSSYEDNVVAFATPVL